MMNQTEQIMQEYKDAVRDYIKHSQGRQVYKRPEYYEGRMSGLEVALTILGIDKKGIRDMYALCEEETMDLLAQEVEG